MLSVDQLLAQATLAEPLIASTDEQTSEAYCRIVSDIATVTLRSRDGAVTSIAANLLWEAIVAAGERRAACWGLYQQSIRRLLADLAAKGGPHEAIVIAAAARLRAFVAGDARAVVDEAQSFRAHVLVHFAMRQPRVNLRFAGRKASARKQKNVALAT
jgi:hypothetical protein